MKRCTQFSFVCLSALVVAGSGGCTDEVAHEADSEPSLGGKADDSIGGMDLGGAFVYSSSLEDGQRTFPYTHFLPGARPHGSYIVIGLGTKSRTQVGQPKSAFESFWNVRLDGVSALYRASRLTVSYVGEVELGLMLMPDGTTPMKVDAFKVEPGECLSRTKPGAPGVQRLAIPTSATPGTGEPDPGVTTPFITEICNPSTESVSNGFAFVELYIP